MYVFRRCQQGRVEFLAQIGRDILTPDQHEDPGQTQQDERPRQQPVREPFDVPEDIRDAWRIAGLRSTQKHKSWQQTLEESASEIRGEFERRFRGDLPADFEAAIHNFKQQLAEEPQTLATRKASQAALEVLNEVVPETIGGSADLTGSNNTKTSQTAPITPDDFSGRFVHYGIREHAMAAAMNGMALPSE